jgi:hypothetical protein
LKKTHDAVEDEDEDEESKGQVSVRKRMRTRSSKRIHLMSLVEKNALVLWVKPLRLRVLSSSTISLKMS